ncbi:TonB-dependent receptor domain-containing protein [Dickeya solani]|uniref:TonB-dependent receptor n=1 Tax=Dickeya solani TaxID=1089444 RepID=A0ABU4EBR1_9GAMM|nr:TonB-dependent receptor [Dickeya solani]MCA6998070.1 TonB-dependent receptor [Dickeya solani]MCZ0822771.1 TonB-dependent receptor [Dickeya solani]MDV6993729.1 TonB-dependent receptor [Dickeya solani]MDV7003193.1 TonB-dependent receptor [Dickeya solani]MDV7038059.1 TonB-dependent receptor [Dickeya solani]
MFLHNKETHRIGLNRIMLTGILTGLACPTLAADTNTAASSITTTSSTATTSSPTTTDRGTKKAAPADNTAAASSGDQMTVMSPRVTKPGTTITMTDSDMQKHGGNDFGSIMRYQPLVSATGVSGGSGAGKSGFDRGGYTGYNIRGLESNRVAIDVDGIPLPNATGRSYAGRPGLNTFGIGRDYIDPYMYGLVSIDAGATPIERANNAIGGAVSFRPKSPDQYLSVQKDHYIGYQSDYDSASRSWHNGVTVAGGDQTLRGIAVVSRRDGQETRTNSDRLSAYPLNWHSTAVMTSAIWQPNDQHRFTGTLDYYSKTSHTHYDGWNNVGTSIVGTSQQDSDSERWSGSLRHNWTSATNTGWVDAVDSRIYAQRSTAKDDTDMPLDDGSMQKVNSDYNVRTYGVETSLLKSVGMHQFTWGFNAQQSDTERPFHQSPAQTGANVVMQPEADSRSYSLGGFVQDKMEVELAGKTLAITPGVRVAHQSTKSRNLSSLSAGSSVITAADVQSLYGKTTRDTEVLPSLSLQYELTPRLSTYLQYRRGAQFPDASQLYGSWSLGSSYAGRAQYALIGNGNLETETSNNYEWGLKGDATEGISFRTAVFYNDYKNFIANTRYTRAANPEKFTNVPSNIYTAYQMENRDKAYIYGAEFSSRVQWGTWFDALGGFSTTLAVGYNEGKSKSRYLGDKYVDLDSVAPVKAVVGLAWDEANNRYGAAITSTFQKGKRATATNRQGYNNTGAALTDSTTEYMRVPGYGLVDLTAYWRVLPNVRLSGGVYNLTDRKYWDYLSSRQLTLSTAQDGYNRELAVMPGRTFQLGVNVDF